MSAIPTLETDQYFAVKLTFESGLSYTICPSISYREAYDDYLKRKKLGYLGKVELVIIKASEVKVLE